MLSFCTRLAIVACVLPEYRIVTVATGILLTLAAPALLRIGGNLGRSLALLAWSWGWSRILISFALPPADLQTRLMVYAFIAAAASACAVAASLLFVGRRQRMMLALCAMAAVGASAWFVADPDAWLGGRVAALNLIFPILLASLSFAGLAALHRGYGTGDRPLTWLGIGLLMLPAIRGMDLTLDFMFSEYWSGTVAVLDSLLTVATVVMLVVGGIMAARGPGPTFPLVAITTGIILGAVMSTAIEYMPTLAGRHARFTLDALIVLVCTVSMLHVAFPVQATATPGPLVPAQGP